MDCAWPGSCPQPTLGEPLCYYHTKLVEGLMDSAAGKARAGALAEMLRKAGADPRVVARATAPREPQAGRARDLGGGIPQGRLRLHG